jgi:Xaa-Pro aminopeptidase
MNTASRQQRAAELLAKEDSLVLVAAGEPITIPGGQDQVYRFVPHPHYRWLTGSARPGGVMAFDPASGWSDFRVPVSAAEQVWEGAQPQPLGAASDVTELSSWLAQRGGKRIALIGSAPAGVQPDEEASLATFRALEHLRRAKDKQELALVQRAVAATAAGFGALPQWLGPGVSEREVGIRLEAVFFMAGAQTTGYGTIVGSGTNSAVLHWPPTDRTMQDGEIVLVDAGGEIDGYTADVTRVYPVSGTWTGKQSELYSLLLAAQMEAVELCQVGTEWGELHLVTALRLAEGLRELGVLTVSGEQAVESEAIGLFFPHGLGHMVGMGVRDASGLAPGRSEARTFAGARIRMDLPLAENYLVTVEPGLYFIPALLNDPEKRQKHAKHVAWDKLEPWLALGGMRIEDNVLVTSEGPQNLTRAIAK